MEEATDPEGTTLEDLVEGTTLFLWKTMFPQEQFPGADMIMRAETNFVVALLRFFKFIWAKELHWFLKFS